MDYAQKNHCYQKCLFTISFQVTLFITNKTLDILIFLQICENHLPYPSIIMIMRSNINCISYPFPQRCLPCFIAQSFFCIENQHFQSPAIQLSFVQLLNLVSFYLLFMSMLVKKIGKGFFGPCMFLVNDSRFFPSFSIVPSTHHEWHKVRM